MMLKQKECMKMCVIIDHKLCWKPHINNIKTYMSRIIEILFKTKDMLNQSSLYIMYCSLTVPYNTCCVEVCGNTYKTNTNPMFHVR